MTEFKKEECFKPLVCAKGYCFENLNNTSKEQAILNATSVSTSNGNVFNVGETVMIRNIDPTSPLRKDVIHSFGWSNTLNSIVINTANPDTDMVPIDRIMKLKNISTKTLFEIKTKGFGSFYVVADDPSTASEALIQKLNDSRLVDSSIIQAYNTIIQINILATEYSVYSVLGTSQSCVSNQTSLILT